MVNLRFTLVISNQKDDLIKPHFPRCLFAPLYNVYVSLCFRWCLFFCWWRVVKRQYCCRPRFELGWRVRGEEKVGPHTCKKKKIFRVTGVRWTIPAKTPCPALCTLNYYRLPCKPPPPLRFSNSTASFSWLWLGLILFIYLLLVSGHLILFFPEWPCPA